MVALEAEGKLDGVGQGRAGVAGHEVRNEVLLLADGFGDGEEFFAEALVHREGRFAHAGKHRVGAMLGRDLELTADVILHQLAEKGVVGIGHEVIKANAAADKDLFHLRERLDLLDQLHVFGVIHLQILAGGGGEALASCANAVLELLVAGGIAEVCGGTANVVDVALKVGQLRDLFCLLDHAFDASGAHGASLVEGERAEVAAAKAAAVVGDGEFYLLNARNASRCLVGGVVVAHIGQGVNVIQLLALKRGHGGILHQELAVVHLADGATVDGVLVLILHAEGLGVGSLAFLQLVIVKGGRHGEVDQLLGLCEVDRSAHVADLANGHASVEQTGDAKKDILAHAVGQEVGAAIHENGAAHLVVPVIVMRKAAERRLKTADHDRHVAKGLANAVAVHDHGAVGALAHHASGGVIVKAALLAGGGVMRHHAVDVAGRDEKAETGLSEFPEGVAAFVIGLGENGHAEAGVLQHAGDDGHAKGGVVHVGVTRDVYKVGSIPAACLHIGTAEG